MTVYRCRIEPLSAWRTPWHADTLTGRLCSIAAQLWGAEKLQSDLLDFFLAGIPPFVLSDAFPDDCLPIPVTLRLLDWDDVQRKKIKRARWLSPTDFERVRAGERIFADSCLPDDAVVRRDRWQNTINRQTGTTGENSLFSETEVFRNTTNATDPKYLSLYVRIEDGFEDRFMELLSSLAREGFGADVSTGYGAFRLAGPPEPLPRWYEQPDANGLIVLSTFQPAPNDPTDGYWEAFVKYGKLGPGFGVVNVFKRPIVLLRAGASFRSESKREFLGRALPAVEFLEPETMRQLRIQGLDPIHIAYGLAVPCVFK